MTTTYRPPPVHRNYRQLGCLLRYFGFGRPSLTTEMAICSFGISTLEEVLANKKYKKNEEDKKEIADLLGWLQQRKKILVEEIYK